MTAPLPKIEPTPADPPATTAVLNAAKAVEKEAKLTAPLELSAPIRSPAAAIEPWIVCMRGGQANQTRRLTYSLYFTGDAYSKSKMSSVIDGCENAAYAIVTPEAVNDKPQDTKRP